MIEPITRNSAIKQNILNGHLPTLTEVRKMLRYNPYVSKRDKVLDAYLIGSSARGTDSEDSDIDIAVVIPAKKRKTAVRFTEEYHASFTSNTQKNHWQGRCVDLQFFYPGSQELEECTRVKLSGNFPEGAKHKRQQ